MDNKLKFCTGEIYNTHYVCQIFLTINDLCQMKSYHSDNSRRRSPPTEEEITSTCTFPLYKIYISFFFLYTYVLLNITLFSLSLSISHSFSHLYFHIFYFLSHSRAYTDNANAEDQNTAFGSRCSLESSRSTGSIN